MEPFKLAELSIVHHGAEVLHAYPLPTLQGGEVADGEEGAALGGERKIRTIGRREVRLSINVLEKCGHYQMILTYDALRYRAKAFEQHYSRILRELCRQGRHKVHHLRRVWFPVGARCVDSSVPCSGVRSASPSLET